MPEMERELEWNDFDLNAAAVALPGKLSTVGWISSPYSITDWNRILGIPKELVLDHIQRDKNEIFDLRESNHCQG